MVQVTSGLKPQPPKGWDEEDSGTATHRGITNVGAKLGGARFSGFIRSVRASGEPVSAGGGPLVLRCEGRHQAPHRLEGRLEMGVELHSRLLLTENI
ncbi:hypothetical protein E2C01_078366 [Portunus trituberculatus]|uniref:Uncharacterized protein n=1 Tax=Portunus trituberculatus TaxID=210409 RepID=A0A5B7IE48_PORTR|nr:hypothetical protein [Portunus trituberculatus]